MINSKSFKVESLIYTVFFLCPFFIVAGPIFKNIFVILVFSLSIYCYIKNNYKFSLLNYEIIFLIFLIYLLVTNLVIFNVHGIVKVFYLSIFFFVLVCFRYIKPKFIFSRKHIKIYLSLFFILIIDAFIQYYFGKNLFGYELADGNRVSGIFNDEAILGSFFSKFLILLISFFLIEKRKFSFLLLSVFLTSFVIIIFLSGERSAFILSIILLLTYFIYIKKYKYLLSFLSFILIFNIILFNTNYLKEYKKKYLTYIGDLGISKSISEKYSTQQLIDSEHKKYIFSENFNYLSEEEIAKNLGITVQKVQDLKVNNSIKYDSFLNTYHGGLFARAIVLSKQNLLFGHGIKKYRIICSKAEGSQNKNFNSNFVYKKNIYKYYCSTHPHNIYLELLVETGLIGLTLFIVFIFLFLLKLKNKKFNYLEKSVILTNFALFFPFLPTGSFFSSQYFIYFFFFIIFATNYLNIDEYNKSL